MAAIGITGGIATGKSTVAELLSQALESRLAHDLFSADFEARRLTSSDFSVQEEIRSAFGPDIFDPAGNLLRERLRELVFHDATARKALELILHPRIRSAWVNRVRGGKLLIAEIPLLYETQAENNFDLIVVTACSVATQRDRLSRRWQLTEALTEQILSAQIDLKSKMDRADRVIWTEGPIEITRQQVDRVSREVIQFYGGAAS